MAASPPPAPASADAWPAIVRPVDPPSAGPIGRVAVVLAGLALLAYLVAGVLLAVPVETPQVQDCGTPAAFLLAGRLNTFPDQEDRIRDADGRIVTLEPAVADAARTRPCRDRVADRGFPAAVLLLVATVTGLVAFALELFVVRPRQRRAIRAARAEGLAPPADRAAESVPAPRDPRG